MRFSANQSLHSLFNPQIKIATENIFGPQVGGQVRGIWLSDYYLFRGRGCFCFAF